MTRNRIKRWMMKQTEMKTSGRTSMTKIRMRWSENKDEDGVGGQ